MTQDIANAVARYFAAIDGRDWASAQSLMTNPFHLDYSSFGAGPAADLDPTDVLAGWKGMLPGFDATHHQLGPLDIETRGDEAVVRAYVTATHQIVGAEGGDLWTVYGDYMMRLVLAEPGWEVRGLVFQFRFLTGNPALPSHAQERAVA